MKILSIFFVLIAVQITAFNLSVTPYGLVGRLRESPIGSASFVFDTQISTPSFSPMLMRNMDDRFHSFPLGPESEFASRTNSTMILPLSESQPFFRMIMNPADPKINCFEGTMGVAEIIPGSSVGFAAGVVLIPSSNETNTSRPIFDEAPAIYPYELSTFGPLDVIPRSIYNMLLGEITRLGVRTTENENINLLPTIEYTIYRSIESEVAVARIISEPRDYLESTASGIRLMVQPSSGFTPFQIGINTLKHMGILIDYRNHQIGFCEPL